MATYTSNYGWTKPSGSDNVDISVLNNNLDDQDSTIHDAFLNMAPPFSESSTYTVDDIVLYDTGLYKCHTAVVTPGSWTGSTNWQVYKLSEGGGGSSLTAGDYIDITAGVISVTKEKGEYSLERYVLQSTGGGAPKLVVKKYIDSELISTNEYANNTAHVNIDDTLEIWYSYNPYNWHYKLLVDGVDHSAGYEYEFSYEDTTEYPVDFHIAAGDSTDLVTKGDLDYADLPNKPSINGVTLSGNKTASELGLQDELTFDNVPTDGSNNPVKSDGIYDALASKSDKTTTATGETLSLVPTSEGRALIHTAYGMSVQDGTPTPSAPVDIVSAKADFRSVGKNLIPYPYTDASGHLDNGITFNYDNSGKLLLSGTNDNINESDITLSLSNHYIKANTHYILSGDTNDDRAFVAVWFTPGKDQSGGVSKTVHWILSNDPTIYTASMTNIRTYDSRIAINYKYIEFWLDEDTWVAVTARTVRGDYTLPNNTYLLPMLRLADVTDDTYEPYTKHDVTTDLTLRAIEVSSTDDYNLEKDGKYYIADTLDYSEDNGFVVTRRVAEYEVLGNEGWIYIGDAGSKRMYIAQSTLGISAKSGATEQGCSSRFTYNGKTVSSIEWGNYYFSSANLVISLNNNSDIIDQITAENWLSSNKPIFEYILTTPTTENITTEQALALLGLKTYDESTTISSQAEPACTIAVEYAKERLGALALTAYNTARGNDLRITALEA